MSSKFDIYVFYYYHCADTTAGGLLVPDDIIRQVVKAPALTCFIWYIHYWNLQFLNNVICIKEEFEDTKGIIRIRISKNRQYNRQKKKYKRTNNDLQNIHIKLKIE